MSTGTHITLPSTPFGIKTQAAMATLQSAVEQFRQLKNIANSYTSNGTAAANLEDPTGPSIPAGSGQTLYADISAVAALIDVAGVTTGVAKYIG